MPVHRISFHGSDSTGLNSAARVAGRQEEEEMTMTWARVGKSAQGLAARSLLLCFTVFLALKIDKSLSFCWWFVFVPLWLFHVAIARHRFSLPAPLLPHGRQWAPCHAVVATPLLVSFELLICIYLENIDAGSKPVMDLKVVFLPLLAFEITVLIDNFRTCRNLIPADEEPVCSEVIYETLPHFWVAISMVFLVATTSFVLLKLCGKSQSCLGFSYGFSHMINFYFELFAGDVDALGWWELFITLGSFLIGDASSPSTIDGYHSLISGLPSSMERHNEDRVCGLQDIGSHVMKVPVVVFQILLCMRLEGTPPAAKDIPIVQLFSLIYIVQGLGILFATWRLLEKLFILLRRGSLPVRYDTMSRKAYNLFASIHHGSRLLGWWCTDERSKEEQAYLVSAGSNGYDTFCGYSPDVVKKMTKKDLTQELMDAMIISIDYCIYFLLLRFGDFKRLWENKLKSQIVLKRSMKNSKMRRFFVGFASRRRSVLSLFPVGTTYYASPALRSVINVPFVVLSLRNGCSYVKYDHTKNKKSLA
ncbi:hypothetical protein ZIOFF_008027 [Zingiber officinale]|uniref:Uncharacterized protein n=1 Tax=Zingiber officinale TaxID=94328 RepID=A0A8J5HVI1_ZINOF|nr:hypothetical protein ZIOFF_008027 [Zingiber officinale]